MGVSFTDYSVQVKEAIDNTAIAFLEEVGGEIQASAARNSRVDTGQLKGSWNYKVDEGKKEATIGSPLENAIWEEFGTGEQSINGKGRLGWHGKSANRTLFRAFEEKKTAIINRAKQLFRGLS